MTEYVDFVLQHLRMHVYCIEDGTMVTSLVQLYRIFAKCARLLGPNGADTRVPTLAMVHEYLCHHMGQRDDLCWTADPRHRVYDICVPVRSMGLWMRLMWLPDVCTETELQTAEDHVAAWIFDNPLPVTPWKLCPQYTETTREDRQDAYRERGGKDVYIPVGWLLQELGILTYKRSLFDMERNGFPFQFFPSTTTYWNSVAKGTWHKGVHARRSTSNLRSILPRVPSEEMASFIFHILGAIRCSPTVHSLGDTRDVRLGSSFSSPSEVSVRVRTVLERMCLLVNDVRKKHDLSPLFDEEAVLHRSYVARIQQSIPLPYETPWLLLRREMEVLQLSHCIRSAWAGTRCFTHHLIMALCETPWTICIHTPSDMQCFFQAFQVAWKQVWRKSCTLSRECPEMYRHALCTPVYMDYLAVDSAPTNADMWCALEAVQVVPVATMDTVTPSVFPDITLHVPRMMHRDICNWGFVLQLLSEGQVEI